jgi:DNA gyrase inhibitor GyrI
MLHRGPYNEIGQAFGMLFGHLHSPAGAAALSTAGITTTVVGDTLGLYLDDPETTKPEDLRSYAAVDITKSFTVDADNNNEEDGQPMKKGWWPSEWETIQVGGGLAAVMTVNGSYDQLSTSWKNFSTRIKELGWTMSTKPDKIDCEVYIQMDEEDSSKNVTKLIVFLEED